VSNFDLSNNGDWITGFRVSDTQPIQQGNATTRVGYTLQFDSQPPLLRKGPLPRPAMSRLIERRSDHRDVAQNAKRWQQANREEDKPAN
jgi:hypothetical protein